MPKGYAGTGSRLKELIHAAEAAGWILHHRGGKHPRLLPPAGACDTAGRPCRPLTLSSAKWTPGLAASRP